MTDPIILRALNKAIVELSRNARMSELNIRYASGDLLSELIEKTRELWQDVQALKELRDRLNVKSE